VLRDKKVVGVFVFVRRLTDTKCACSSNLV
jgi:hypothetical protein